MKRPYLALLFALMLAFTFVACGGSTQDTANTDQDIYKPVPFKADDSILFAAMDRAHEEFGKLDHADGEVARELDGTFVELQPGQPRRFVLKDSEGKFHTFDLSKALESADWQPYESGEKQGTKVRILWKGPAKAKAEGELVAIL